jgi:hypothetical protein
VLCLQSTSIPVLKCLCQPLRSSAHTVTPPVSASSLCIGQAAGRASAAGQAGRQAGRQEDKQTNSRRKLSVAAAAA